MKLVKKVTRFWDTMCISQAHSIVVKHSTTNNCTTQVAFKAKAKANDSENVSMKIF